MSYALRGAEEANKDVTPVGVVVGDPVFRELLFEDGMDPDSVWGPPIDAEPGEYTLNDLVKFGRENSIAGLRSWLPEGKGTWRGSFEVELVNSFVEELFPLLSDEGGEWKDELGPDEKLLHDLLNEDIAWPAELDYNGQIAWVENMLQEYREGASE